MSLRLPLRLLGPWPGHSRGHIRSQPLPFPFSLRTWAWDTEEIVKLRALPPHIAGFLGKLGIKVEIDICVIFKITLSVIFNYRCAFRTPNIPNLPVRLPLLSCFRLDRSLWFHAQTQPSLPAGSLAGHTSSVRCEDVSFLPPQRAVLTCPHPPFPLGL